MPASKRLGIDEPTLRIMGALVRMPPKHHDEMKVGKPKRKPKKSADRRKSARKAG
jgi:hypothetical protein